MKLIHSIKENCTLCYACIRVCPSKALKIEDEHAVVIENRCIGCGHCTTACSFDALHYHQSQTEVEQILQENETVIAICAPSIAGEFEDISSRRNFVGMIKSLGFKYVCEVSFGADLVGHKYKELIENFKGKYYISTNCPAVTSYVEKYHPDTINNLAPLVTPMVATAKAVRQMYGAEARVVYIGPCTAAKMEAKRFTGDEAIDAVLTFVELRELFTQRKITENTVEYAHFDAPRGAKGALFPISGGLFQAVGLRNDMLSGRVICTEGRFNFIEAIKEFENLHALKKHLDLFYCDGGCTMGPGTSKGGQKFYRRSLVIAYTKKQLEELHTEQWKEQVAQHLKLDLSRTFQSDDQRLGTPSQAEIQKVLQKLGKTNEEDHMGCGACGYSSCSEFAAAVSQGLASPDMCLSNSRANWLKMKKELDITREKLQHTLDNLEQTQRSAHSDKEATKSAQAITQLMLQKVPSGVVIVDKQLKIIHANERLIKLLGEDAESIHEVIPGLRGADLKSLLPHTIINFFLYALSDNDEVENRDIRLHEQLLNLSVFPLIPGEVAGAVIKDMYLPEVQREEVLTRITDVIDKNLKMVQNIGFLLGEGASETEKMLRSIMDSYNPDKQK